METHLNPDVDSIVKDLLSTNGCFEIHKIIADYICYRKHPFCDSQKIHVQIRDMGLENPNARYQWKVWAPGAECDGPILGNPADTIVAAGTRLHWNILDCENRCN